MTKRKASSLMLAALFMGTLVSALDICRPQTASASTSMPSFVTDNKLIYESGATSQWLDPHVAYYQYDFWILWHSVETLLWHERDNATKIIPWLAESCTVSDDGLQYTFTLREGIMFQDGTPFNATAVWFSLNRLLMMDGTAPIGWHGSQAAWIVQQLLDPSLSSSLSGEDQAYDAAWVEAVLAQNFVEILAPYEVRINVMTPTTQFCPVMAAPWAAIISPTSTIAMDYEYHGWGTWDRDYNTYFERIAGNGDTGLNLPETGWRVGTGAYYVESVQSIAPYTIVLKAFDAYWGGPDNLNLPPPGKDRIAAIEFVYLPSFATRLLHLETGVATGIQVPTSSMFQVVDRDKWIDDGILESRISGVTTHGVFPQFTTWWLCFSTNVTDPDGALKSWQPFADWRIRMAAACAVNLTHMNLYVNQRLGILADNIIPPGTLPFGAHNPEVTTTFAFDLARARNLLRDARDNPMDPTYY
jgi:ABC-type transport system substrate-binding protein